VSHVLFAGRMSTQTLTRSPAEMPTERVDAVECLDARALHCARPPEPTRPGRYIEVRGHDSALLIALGRDVIHVGRGLAADLRLDESSVSRRHAILVPRASGARILDDRSSYGTFVNGRRIQQTELYDGDVIVLGRVMLRYLEF
jgi:hypothetical protein